MWQPWHRQPFVKVFQRLFVNHPFLADQISVEHRSQNSLLQPPFLFLISWKFAPENDTQLTQNVYRYPIYYLFLILFICQPFFCPSTLPTVCVSACLLVVCLSVFLLFSLNAIWLITANFSLNLQSCSSKVTAQKLQLKTGALLKTLHD